MFISRCDLWLKREEQEMRVSGVAGDGKSLCQKKKLSQTTRPCLLGEEEEVAGSSESQERLVWHMGCRCDHKLIYKVVMAFHQTKNIQ